MKNIITIVLSGVCLGATAQHMSVGGKVGSANTTIIHGSEYFDSIEMLDSFNSSLTLEYRFHPNFYAGGGIMYSQRGFMNATLNNYDAQYNMNYTATGDYKYEYVSMPLYAGVKTGHKLYPFFNLGILASRPVTLTVEREYTLHRPTVFMGNGRYKLASTSMDYTLQTELGIGYELSDNLSATFSASYIRDIKSQLAYRFHGVLTHVGMRYSL